MHPYLQCERLVSYAQSLGMVVTAFSPLGHGKSYAGLGYENVVSIKEDVVINIFLRWVVPMGYSVIPKSENEQRIKENLSIEGFKLSDADMEKMKSLEKNFRMNDPGHFCKFFNTPCPIWD